MVGVKSGAGKGKTQKFAVEKYGVEEEVLKHYRKNVPATKISKILAEKGIKIAPLGINRWLAKQRKKDTDQTQLISKEKFDVMLLDYEKEIHNIMNDVKDLEERFKHSTDVKELAIFDKMIGRLLQGIELLAKLRGDMKGSNKSIDINILIGELNERVFEEKKGLRNKLFDKELIDVEAEVINEDNKRIRELRG